MKQKTIPVFITSLLVILFLAAPAQRAAAQTPVPTVRAVLFFSPGCGHCNLVIEELLKPLLGYYGEQLEMIWFDVSQSNGPVYYWIGQQGIQVDGVQPDGITLYFAAAGMFELDYTGVPFLLIGDKYYFGSVDIPTYLPGLIDSHLAAGGVDWPPIPGLAEWITAYQSMPPALPTPTLEPAAHSTPTPDLYTVTPTSEAGTPLIEVDTHQISLGERLARDPAGNALAIFVLVGMLVAVGWGSWRFLRKRGHPLTGARLWLIPVLCILGLGVAGYLAYVETLQVEAVCGPVGDCNTVQQSEYAYLFGILPIGLLGVFGYIAILAAWALQLLPTGKLVDWAALAMLAMTTFGTFFSIYLTFLEPFVIGATCAWCLTASVIMTTLMLLSIPSAKLALKNIF